MKHEHFLLELLEMLEYLAVRVLSTALTVDHCA